MPQKAEPKKPYEGPSLLQKIFGYGKMAPNIEEGIQIAKMEHPNMPTPQRSGIVGKGMNLLMQQFGPGAPLAATSPFGGINLNENRLVGHSPQDIADLLAHENTHVEQQRKTGLLGNIYKGFQESDIPYWQRPSEVEAFRASADRQNRMGRMVDTVPSVIGSYYKPADVNLPNPGSIDYNTRIKALTPTNYTRLNPKTGQYEKVIR